MLISIITPPYYLVILTNSPPILSFPVRASLLRSAKFYKQPCILAVCACSTQENYKTHHIKLNINNETTLHAYNKTARHIPRLAAAHGNANGWTKGWYEIQSRQSELHGAG